MKSEIEKHLQHAKDWAKVFHYPKYRTAITYLENDGDGNMVVNKLYYHIVTPVNHHTATLWLQHRNSKIKNGSKGFVLLPEDKPNWLVMVRNFRRKQDSKIKVMEYIIERQNRNKK